MESVKFLSNIFVFFLMLSSCTNSSSNDPVPVASDFVCQSTPVPKGSRQFGMDILDVPSVGSYTDSFNNLKNMGGSFQTFHVNWNSIEGTGSAATSGAFTDPYGGLAALDALATAQGIKVTLRIHPVDVPGKFVPSDLMNTRFNQAHMQTRFQNMLNFVFTKINPSNVTRLVVGNEIDGYNPGADTNFWQDYPTFLYDLNVWLTTNYPTVDLGIAVTAVGATDSTKVLANSGGLLATDVFKDSSWYGVIDFVGVTYYPLNSSFQLKPNNQVASVFQTLVSSTSLPVHIEEVGYSSSTTNGGSENLQAEFFCEVFKAWDAHSARIPSLAVLRMVDKTRSDAESVAGTYGLTGNENFIEYIRSLGIRTNANQPKRSFTMIESELNKRGF